MPVFNGQWTIQGVTFEEVPGAPMVTYPSDWTNDAIWVDFMNDFGQLRVMVSSAAGGNASWRLFSTLPSRTGRVLINDLSGALHDTASLLYYGYGFQFYSDSGPALGIGDLYLDGGLLASIDYYSATALGANLMAEAVNVPLGQHLVQLVATQTKNEASSGYAVQWDALKVMR